MKYKITGKFNIKKVIALLERFQYENVSANPKIQNNIFRKKTTENNVIRISLENSVKSDIVNIVIALRLNHQQLIKLTYLRLFIFSVFVIFIYIYDLFFKEVLLDYNWFENYVLHPLSAFLFYFFWYRVNDQIYSKTDAQIIQEEILLTEEQ